MERSRHPDQQHLSILDDLVGEVLPDVNVLGALTAADDVGAPFDTRRVVLVDRGRLLLPETESVHNFSTSALRYKTSQPAADAEYYSASAVESAVVFCIFDFHMIGDLLYSMTVPDVDLREVLLPQSAFAYPDKRSTSFIPQRYSILKLGCAARYSIRWWRTAYWAEPADAQNRANCDTANEMTNRIHVAAK